MIMLYNKNILYSNKALDWVRLIFNGLRLDEFFTSRSNYIERLLNLNLKGKINLSLQNDTVYKKKDLLYEISKLLFINVKQINLKGLLYDSCE